MRQAEAFMIEIGSISKEPALIIHEWINCIRGDNKFLIE